MKIAVVKRAERPTFCGEQKRSDENLDNRPGTERVGGRGGRGVSSPGYFRGKLLFRPNSRARPRVRRFDTILPTVVVDREAVCTARKIIRFARHINPVSPSDRGTRNFARYFTAILRELSALVRRARRIAARRCTRARARARRQYCSSFQCGCFH